MGNRLGILGTKLGMTQIFDEEEGSVVAVTVIQAEPNVVLRRFTKDDCGYSAIQLGYGSKRATRINRPDAGQFAAAAKASGKDVAPRATIHEFRLASDPADDLAVGSELTVGMLDGVKFVDVAGTSKGKGFQGVMKRHKFQGFERTHGTHEYFRHGGSIGTRLTPGHVFKGKRMPGQMGNVRVTAQNLRVHSVDAARHLVFIVGGVPGSKGSVVEIRPAVKKP